MKLVLKTERLIIRDFREDDWRDIIERTTQEEVALYEPWDTTMWADKEKVTEWIEAQQALTFELIGKYLEFAVVLGDRAIGSVGVKRLSETHKNAEVGWSLNIHFQGRGYATEAARALIDLCFGALELHRITATCDARNTASYKLMERLGMRREAHHLESFFSKGEWTDDLVYAVLRGEWLARPRPSYTVDPQSATSSHPSVKDPV